MMWLRRRNYLSLDLKEKMELIMSLQKLRLESLAESIKKRATKKPRAKKPKKPTFANDALNALFNQMPKDLQKQVTSRRRSK